MREVTFDPASHTYRIDGQIVPSVTQVLKAGGLIGDYGNRYPEAMARGTLVHRLCEEVDTYGDTLADVDGVEGYLEAYRAFLADRRVDWTMIETIVSGDGWAGTLDRFGLVNGRAVVVDIKTGNPAPWHAVQLWAYRLGADQSRAALAGLYLRADGEYSLKVITENAANAAARKWGEAWGKYSLQQSIEL